MPNLPIRTLSLDAKNAKEDAKVARTAARTTLYSSASFASFFATLASQKTLPDAVSLEERITAFEGMTWRAFT
jgi:hypothetical protein